MIKKNYRKCISIFYITFARNISYSRNKWARYYHKSRGTRWRSWLRHCATSRKVAVSIPDGVIGIFHLHHSFRPSYGPWVDSASNRNEYQEYFLGVKAAGAQGWQSYRLHVPMVLKSGNLSLLEHSGPVEACNGIDLTFYYHKCT